MKLVYNSRQHWARDTSGHNKKEKQRLTKLIDDLDKKAESSHLTTTENQLKKEANERLAQMLREQELSWYERSKVEFLLKGDSNTGFYHLVANGRYRKQQIYQLDQDEGTIIGEADLKKYITKYYKGLFRPPDENSFSLDESRRDEIPQVSPHENDFLRSEFSEQEVRDAVFQMEHNKAPGPDGFPAEFYQVFWEIVKGDLLELF